MNQHQRDFCRPPRPPLRKSERGSLLVTMILTAAVACRPAAPSPTTDSAGTSLAVEDTTLVEINPIRTSFLGRYGKLERMGDGWGVLLYPKGRARLINRLRSDLPEGHPLRFNEGLDMEDRVYALVVLPGTVAESVYVIHSDGPSGDPGFYLADGRTGATTDNIWGEILVIPDSGPMMMYQRTNVNFPTVKEVRFQAGKFEEVPVARRSIGLRTIALDTISLWRSPSDSTTVATLTPGDSVVVVEAGAVVDGAGTPLLVKTASGVLGWTFRGGSQCNVVPIRGICFLGD